MLFGLHVSIANGLFNAPNNAAKLGCETFQMFSRPPQGGSATPLTNELINMFKTNCQKFGFINYYLHTPYFINYASKEDRIRHGSISVVRQELERGNSLGVKALMTHLGSGKDFSLAEAKQQVVNGLLETLDGYNGQTQFLIELAAGAGMTLGSSFSEIAFYINAVEKKDKRLKNKIGVCLDTCHAFAVGYDLRQPNSVKKVLQDFNQSIGLSRLILIHANDSKTEFNSRKDRHQHLGLGEIGLAGFQSLVEFKPLKNIDFIVETPHDGLETTDLKNLKSFRNL